MKKTLLSLAAVAITLSASAEKTLWTMSDFKEANPAINTATTYTYNGLTFYGDSKSDYAAGATVDVENYSFKFDGRIKLGGASVFQSNKTMSRVFEFEADANEPILVFFTHGSSSGDPRGTYLSNAATTTKNDTSTAFAKLAADAGSKACLSGVNPTTGKVYVWCDNNNAIYAIAKGYTLEELNDFMNGSSEDPAEGEEITFNLEDFSKWGKPEQNVTAKGTVIYNEADKTYTFPNFLGSKTDVTFAVEAVEGSTLFKVVPQNNVTVGTGDFYGAPVDTYTFPGLESNNSIWFGLDGVNSVCFSNPTFYGYKASSASKEAEKLVDTPTSANDYRYYYAVTFYIASKYCNWNPATGAADAVSATPGSFNLKFNLEIPASDDQSGIDSIVTDSADENAPVEYYNLQGIRLSEPAAGQIVIRRQGSKVSKIVVR